MFEIGVGSLLLLRLYREKDYAPRLATFWMRCSRTVPAIDFTLKMKHIRPESTGIGSIKMSSYLTKYVGIAY